MMENLIRAAVLNHFALLHHNYVVADGAHDRQIMADEHISQAVFLLLVAQKFDYFGLYGAVKRRGRLV